MPPQICITSLEELSVIWDYCGKKILYPSIMKNFAVKLYSWILQMYSRERIQEYLNQKPLNNKCQNSISHINSLCRALYLKITFI